MSSTVLPAEFRCFRHILHIYARNLPLHATETDVDDCDDDNDGDRKNLGDVGERGITPHQLIAESSGAGRNSVSRTACQTTTRQRCVSSYFILSKPPNISWIGSSENNHVSNNGNGNSNKLEAKEDSRIYMSEVCRDTQHPVWNHIPEDTRRQCQDLTRFVFSLYYCTTHPEEALPDPETDFLLYAMLIQTSHVQYVAPSITKADSLPSLPYHVDNGANSFVVLLRCIDGVFFPMHQGVQLDEGGAVIEVTSRPYLYDVNTSNISNNSTLTAAMLVEGFANAMRQQQQQQNRGLFSSAENITVGDLKAYATASLAWVYLANIAAAHREEQEQMIDAIADTRRNEAAVGAQHAILEVRLAKARRRLNQQSEKIHELHERYKKEHETLISERLQLDHLQEGIISAEQLKEKMEKKSEEEEVLLASRRAELGSARKLRIGELRALFPIQIGTSGMADTICGHSLPMKGKDTVMTGDLMEEWALALGYAAHLVITAAAIYGCVLPHPLLVCGTRSCVLTKPGLPASAVVTPCTGINDVKLPLYCTRAADRPLMLAAIQLFLQDVAVLAKVMGYPNIATDAVESDMSLGVILSQLLKSS
ncbi:UV radiation resistance protein/autophagy-related protein 14 [Trypanosoma melophagium]|uniref:UV radiation resistance protein/autophagy-related protein 14 n=1 Tax=Trypanosoma melophagium TaxID=715481 RepID=UPI00351AA350|nr:UV radiation resistance protein/autophagy-related protein 14 [Trypanosoma melophagium]